jgi:glycosyltransferase involved in cell wall biosynthesis
LTSAQRIAFLGRVPHDQLQRLLAESDIAVAPYSRVKNFYFSPLKILDYMAAGTSIIATEQGQIPDLLAHGECGMLIDPDSDEALQRAMWKLAMDAELRAQLASAALRKFRALHTWQAAAGALCIGARERVLQINNTKKRVPS